MDQNCKILNIDTNLENNGNQLTHKPSQEALNQILLNKNVKYYHLQMSNDDHLIDAEIDRQTNYFVESIRMAYQYHIPLLLSPDMFWTAILQGLALHINNSNDIKYPSTKEQLIIETQNPDPWKQDWEQLINSFSLQIKSNLGQKLHDIMIQNFSTTNKNLQLVQEITLMDSFRQFFQYSVVYGCGIPKVKLIGTYDDWKQLRNATFELRQLNLSWWIDHLIPILDKLLSEYQATEGDKDFWNDIYVYRQGGPSYGPSTANGWLTLFFPYLLNLDINDGTSKYIRQEFVYGKQQSLEDSFENRLETSQIPTGLCQAPINFINVLTQSKQTLIAQSGFVKIKVVDGFIQNELGWFIRNEEKIIQYRQ